MASITQCMLIKRLSQIGAMQDIFATEYSTDGTHQYPRCDSSDCLLCHTQRGPCHEHAASSWLERRMSATVSSIADSTSACAPAEDAEQEQQLQQRKRLKRVVSQDSDEIGLAAADADNPNEEQLAFSFRLGDKAWQWREEFADRQLPAPCSIMQVAVLQSPTKGTCRGDMICGLEFSLDGQLIAAAGVSKQVALYPLAALQEQQLLQQQQEQLDWQSKAVQGNSGLNSHAQQQQQLPDVPSLAPAAVIRMPGKISSIAWSPDTEGVMSIGDYDGTLTQVHVASGHYLNEVDAHGGRRIWSVCHSRLRPHLAATASDDCTAKLWAGRGLSAHVATIQLPGWPAVCGVDFSQFHPHLLALAAADARVYLYDLRRLSEPLTKLHGHRRPVSYAKFFGIGQLVSASIDGTLAAWDLGPVLGLAGVGTSVQNSSSSSSNSSSTDTNWQQQQQQLLQAPVCSWQHAAAGSIAGISSEQGHNHQQQQQSSRDAASVLRQPWKVFQGHTNEKNFVGLSVQPTAGLIAVGSESSEVFAYHTSWNDPLARFSVCSQHNQQQQQVQQQMAQPVAVCWPPQQQQQQRSVSAVAWQQQMPGAALQCSPLLAAATSAGDCQLLGLVNP